MPASDDEIMRRRAFLSSALSAAGLAIAPGVLDSAARLVPADLPATAGGKVSELEATVHARALDFPTTPATDSLPALLRNYADACQVADQVPGHLHPRVHGSLAYLAGFLAAQLADQADYEQAHLWYGQGMQHAHDASDREALGWIAGRAALMPWYRPAGRVPIVGDQPPHEAQGRWGHRQCGTIRNQAKLLVRAGESCRYPLYQELRVSPNHAANTVVEKALVSCAG